MLTRRQKAVYEWVEKFIRDQGYAPSYEEIRQGLGLRSLNTVSYHLRHLEAHGFLKSPWRNKKRALELSPWPRSSALLLLGEVQAGYPIENYEVREEVQLPSGIFSPEDHFALRVKGASMADDGIMEGDVIVVRREESAENGQVVVALVDGEATVKKFFRRGPQIELKPSNPSFQSIFSDEEKVKVLGVVVALFRNY
jgi:repressor LexA